MIRNIAFVVSSVIVFGVLNSLIVQKQHVVDSCESVYLKLAPVDPRSLMQGDYMRLDYAVSRAASEAFRKRSIPGAAGADVEAAPELPPAGRLVIATDKDGVANFVRFDNGTPLAPGEKYLSYYNATSGVRLGAESYLFKEGDAKVYEKATYGELRLAPSGETVLMGLCDDKRQLLGKRVSGL